MLFHLDRRSTSVSRSITEIKFLASDHALENVGRSAL